jgi:hypothetical protein
VLVALITVVGEASFKETVPPATLIVLTTIPFLPRITNKTFDVLTPLHLVAGYFFLYYGGKAAYLQLVPSAHRLGFLPYDDYLPYACTLASACFIVFVTGYSLTRSKSGAGMIRYCPLLPHRVPTVRIVMLAALGATAHILELRDGVVLGRTYSRQGLNDIAENPIPGWIPMASHLLELAFAVAALYAFPRSDRSPRDKLKAITLTACIGFLCVVKSISQGIKEPIIVATAMAILIYHYTRKPISIAIAGVLASLVVLTVVPTMGLFRGKLIEEAGGTPQSFEEFWLSMRYGADYFRSMTWEDYKTSTLDFLFSRSHGVDALSLVMKYTPERAPYGYGASYLEIPVQMLVPRSLWTGKPIQSGSRNFERTYMNIDWIAQSSPHLFADWYRNFWYPGAIFISLVMGVMFKHLYTYLCLRGERKSAVLLYSYLVIQAVHAFESDFEMFAVIMVRVTVLIVVTLWILTLSGSSSIQKPMLKQDAGPSRAFTRSPLVQRRVGILP